MHSPLIVETSPGHEELREIAQRCLTRRHVHHYEGFFRTQWRLFEKENPPRVKPLLYCYRVLLTGVHLMRSGEVEGNLAVLAPVYGQDDLIELIEAKRAGNEQLRMPAPDTESHRVRTERLLERLKAEAERSPLPEKHDEYGAMQDFVLRVERPK